MHDDRMWIRVDAAGVVTARSASWNQFVGNHFVGCLTATVPGERFRTLGGAATSLYARLFDRARRLDASAHDVYAAAADRMTKLELTVQRRDAEVELALAPLFERERDQPLPFFDPEAPRGDDGIRTCGFCNRLYGFRWADAETTLRQLRVDRHAPQPRLKPDVCLDCDRRLYDATLLAAG